MWGVSSKLAGCLLGECNGRRGLVPEHLVLELHEPELLGAAVRSAGCERERERENSATAAVSFAGANAQAGGSPPHHEKGRGARDDEDGAGAGAASASAHLRCHVDENAELLTTKPPAPAGLSPAAASSSSASAYTQKAYAYEARAETRERERALTATERVEASPAAAEARQHYRRNAARGSQRKMSSIARLESETGAGPVPLLPRDRERVATRGSPSHMLSPEHAAFSRPHAASIGCSRTNSQRDVDAAAATADSPERQKRISFSKREGGSEPVAAADSDDKTQRYRRQTLDSAARSETSSASSRASLVSDQTRQRSRNVSNSNALANRTGDSPDDRSLQTSPSPHVSQSELNVAAAHTPAGSECSLPATKSISAAAAAASRVRSLTVAGPPAMPMSQESGRASEKGKTFGSDPSMLEKGQSDGAPGITGAVNGSCRATLYERRRKVSAAPFQIPKIVSETVRVTVEVAPGTGDRNLTPRGDVTPTATTNDSAEGDGAHSNPGSRTGSALGGSISGSGSFSTLYRTWSSGSPARSPADSDPGTITGAGAGSSGKGANCASGAIAASSSAAGRKQFNSCAYGGELLPQPPLWALTADGYGAPKRISSTNELPPFERPIELDLSPRSPMVCPPSHIPRHHFQPVPLLFFPLL